MRRYLLFLIVLSSFVLLIGACAPKQLTYVYDFFEMQSLGSGENKWAVSDPTKAFFGANGVSIDRINLWCPYSFKGSFTVEIEIFIGVVPVEKSEDIMINLRNFTTNNDGSYLLMERAGGSSTYSLFRYSPSEPIVHDASLSTALLPGAVNVVKLSKTAGKLEYWLNDEPLGAVSGLLDSPSTLWGLMIRVYDGLNESLMFHGIRKVTIKYGPGNRGLIG